MIGPSAAGATPAKLVHPLDRPATSSTRAKQAGGDGVGERPVDEGRGESGHVWPPLDLSAERPVEERARELARYVAPGHILHHGFQITEAPTLRRTAATTEAGNRAVADELVSKVAERGLVYDEQPWSLRGTQLIRHPKQLDSSAATCIDLAVLVASACLANELAPLLAISVGLTSSHAWVIIDLDRDLRSESPEPPMPQPRRWVPARLHELQQAGRFLSLDVSELADGYHSDRSFTASERRDRAYSEGRRLLDGSREILTVDVSVQLEQGPPAYDEPKSDEIPPISRRLPPAPRFRDLSPERARILRELIDARGSALLTGPHGIGKSLLALKSAESAAGGFGWFLSASSANELVINLAATEALHVGHRLDPRSTDPNELKAQAQMALKRLASSRMPWAVVIDNADTDPDAIVPWLPQPNPQHGQQLIVTTTDNDHSTGAELGWAANSLFATRFRLSPLDQELSHLPASLKVEGRPLLSEAWQALSDLSGDPLELLAEEASGLPSELDGPDVLWTLASRRLSRPERQLAAMMSWAPPDAIDESALAVAYGQLETGDAEDDVADHLEQLYRSGLVQPWWPGTARMHRSVGRAVRSAQQRSDPALALRTAAGVVEAGLADPESLAVLADELRTDNWTADKAVRRERSVLLHEVGRRLEPVQGVKPALELLRAAEQLSPQPDPGRQADLEHAEARQQFQHREGDLEQAFRHIDASLSHRLHALQVELQPSGRLAQRLELLRSRALRGLINVARSTEVLGPDAVEQHEPDEVAIAAATELADRGAREVDRALHLRRRLLQPDIPPGGVHPDLLRGEFNQANTAVNLAQHVNRSADERLLLLERAYEHYDNVLDGRLKLRSQPLAQLAASHSGFAIVEYLRATILDLPSDAALRHLRSAATHLHTALSMREDIEPVDSSEVAKTVRLEALISLGRYALVQRRELDPPRYEEEFHKLLRQAIREIRLPW